MHVEYQINFSLVRRYSILRIKNELRVIFCLVMASAFDAEYDGFVDVDSLYSSFFPGLGAQNISLEEMNTADSDFLDLSSQRELIEVANSEEFMENDGKKKKV